MTQPLRILLVESWFGGSHRQWAEGYANNSAHDVRIIGLPDQFWRWRMRGGAITLAERTEVLVRDWGQPDVVVISDLVNVAAYLGLARRSIGDASVAVYFHENQLLYPPNRSGQRDDVMALIDWTSLVAADLALFNSAFHRDAFFAGLGELLDRTPDERQHHLLHEVKPRSEVLHVGLDTAALIDRARQTRGGPPLVVWNQRWDHDKNPEAFLRALVRLAADGVDFSVALVGENQRTDPKEFAWARDELGDRVVHYGELDRPAYLDLLAEADVVVSAAFHEFFGVAVVEAIAAGAVPVLPDRLSYPEVVGDVYHDAVLYPDGELTQRLRSVIEDLDGARARVDGLREHMRRFDWSVLAPSYDQRLSDLKAQR